MSTVLWKTGLGLPQRRVRFWLVTLRLFYELAGAHLVVPGQDLCRTQRLAVFLGKPRLCLSFCFILRDLTSSFSDAKSTPKTTAAAATAARCFCGIATRLLTWWEGVK
jgi:hypothetical protein